MVDFVDLVGFQREDASASFDIEALKTVDALAHVVRGFDSALPHSEGSIDPARHALPDYYVLPLDREVTGWVAISLQRLLIEPDVYGWLNRFDPVERVGKSINLYFIPDPAG